MKYLNDHYKQLINNSQLILAKMKMVKEVQDFYKGFKDDPKELSQWGHNYFCNIDGGRLIYNSNKPHSHVCEICKHEYKDQVYDGVWWYFYRNEAVLTMMKASALYKATGNQVYLEIFKNLILFYANNYQKFPIHDKAGNIYENYEKMKWGCGRILPQGLNEAFITNRMIQALEIVKEDLDQEFLEHLYTNLFIEIYKLLKPQVNKLSNISCWKNVAIGMIGMFFNKKEMIDNAVNGAYGLNYQVKQGVTAEYFWFEGSIHYNYFTLESLSMYLLFSKIYDFPLDADIEDTIKKMMMAGYHYAFNNLYFPNPNDGWPNVNLKTYSYIYHVMTKCYGYDSEIGTILKVISQDKSQRTPVPLSKPYYVLEDLSFENLVLNTDFDNFENISLIQETANYPMSNYGMLRNKYYNVFLKYGHNSPSHAHQDVMNLEVTLNNKFITRDISNAGYKSKMYREWHRNTPAHTTVVVDGLNQVSTHPGKTLIYNSNQICAKCIDVYPGVNYKRDIILNDKEMFDTFFVESKEVHNYDYFFHFESSLDLKYAGSFKLEKLRFSEPGYEHLGNAYKLIKTDNEYQFNLKNQNDEIEILIDLQDKELFILETYDNPVNKMRKTILIRSRGFSAVFKIQLRLI